MANDKAAKPAEAAPAPAEPKKKGPIKLIAVALAVVLLEGGTVGVTIMMSGGPKRANAEISVPTAPKQEPERDAEVLIVEAKLPNSSTGRLFLYDLKVVAKVNEKNKDKMADLLKERSSEVQDRIRTIVASSDSKTLGEPGLETLRRQIGYQLEQDLGKDLVKELLIPRCTPFRAEF